MAINLKLNINPNLGKITVADFNNICRTCSQTNDLVSILQNTYLIGMLQSLSNIQIQLNDELPKKICLNCVKDLNKSYSFISKCKSTDVAYKQCLTKQKSVNFEEKMIKPKSTEEIFIKTEITDVDTDNDPLSDEWTKDPLEYQENTNLEQSNKVKFDGGIMYIRNQHQIPEIARKKRKRSPGGPDNTTPSKTPKKSAVNQKTQNVNEKSANVNLRKSKKKSSQEKNTKTKKQNKTQNT